MSNTNQPLASTFMSTSKGLRVLAFFIDYVIAVIGIFILELIVFFIAAAAIPDSYSDTTGADPVFTGICYSALAIFIIGGIFLYALLVSRKGATLGKLICRIRIVDTKTNMNLSFGRAFARCAVLAGFSLLGFVTLFPLGLTVGLIILLAAPANKNLEDLAGHSMVVKNKSSSS
jgi:uncharacterized RDD family membrane protein YckC